MCKRRRAGGGTWLQRLPNKAKRRWGGSVLNERRRAPHSRRRRHPNVAVRLVRTPPAPAPSIPPRVGTLASLSLAWVAPGAVLRCSRRGPHDCGPWGGWCGRREVDVDGGRIDADGGNRLPDRLGVAVAVRSRSRMASIGVLDAGTRRRRRWGALCRRRRGRGRWRSEPSARDVVFRLFAGGCRVSGGLITT
ncbi:hypothetical protein BD410DRAFT_877884 [Rickenella mellea]|uniref:Uncharacterized protein n=1 Tax=Rickenella mellea TaxID=50990 RepID=A0A4Y7PUX4_9AGAM|nr:hypothetical protein BD410DRAFT_877884 [Rickenella mellea]